KLLHHMYGNFYAPPNRELCKSLMPVLTQWLADGIIHFCRSFMHPNTVEVVPGGLNGASPGLQRLKNNHVGAKKLVIRPWETV
ncbi:hypothetical protein DEU56DRAFT_726022, partial [Suillus clintonianus]|uniref:uncharacterized protein n=1 Tax=Suillus clintonianus TaxID=1904413 RepID=UPI001B883638